MTTDTFADIITARTQRTIIAAALAAMTDEERLALIMRANGHTLDEIRGFIAARHTAHRDSQCSPSRLLKIMTSAHRKARRIAHNKFGVRNIADTIA